MNRNPLLYLAEALARSTMNCTSTIRHMHRLQVANLNGWATSRRFNRSPSRRVYAHATGTGQWAQEDARRLLHAVYNVGDLTAHIEYYTKHFGMQLLRKQNLPAEYTSAHMAFGPESKHFSAKLVYKQGIPSYDLGSGFGHFGVALPDVYKAVETIKSEGGKVTRDAGPVKGGQSIIAFVEDPSGYKWELIQRPSTAEPLCQVMLRVSDLDRSIEFYRKVLGMQLLRTRDNPEYKYSLAFMGYGPEEDNAVLELTYNYGKSDYSPGNAYVSLVVGTSDVARTKEAAKAAGAVVLQPNALAPHVGAQGAAVMDPDGWKTVLVQDSR